MREGREPLPMGAEIEPGGGVRFRTWAPRSKRVEVVLEAEARAIPLDPEPDGFFSGLVKNAGPGTRYRYRLDGKESLPDPASRFQPDGPMGPSEVIDPDGYAWTDRGWPGLKPGGQVLYEMHVGTFTREGTWRAAEDHLPALVELGITTIEMMPVSDFAGRFGWGYDNVDFFAPTRLYGRPDDLRHFVDRAHALGLGVILDIVYNHFGPTGCVLDKFSECFVSDKLTEWGEAPNFDGPNCGPVRAFFLANARYWIDEFHFDGFRIDATQQYFDKSDDHIITAIAREARRAARGRSVYIVGESEPQHPRLMRPESAGGQGLDALWNDDFHHTARIAATRRRIAYYGDYRGTPQEFVSAAKRGYLYQGQINTRQGKRRGLPAVGCRPEQFVLFLQNHDQVANSLRGRRLHQLTSPAMYRAITAVWLLTPGTPLFFQGQEFAASTPFLYFTDQGGDAGKKMRQGRVDFLGQFPHMQLPESQAVMADPCAIETFQASKLDHTERERHREAAALHRDLLRLRREDPTLGHREPGVVDGAVLGPDAFLLRYFGAAGDDRLLVVNFGMDLHLDPAPEPLLAPPEGRRWELIWSSEDPGYGGDGMPPPEQDDNWHLMGESAALLAARPGQGPPANPRPGTDEPFTRSEEKS